MLLLIISWRRLPDKNNDLELLRKYCTFSSDTSYADAELFCKFIPEKIFVDRQIIGCGQSSHGSHENFEIQKLIFENLVEKKECRVFVIEGIYSSVYKINKYVSEGIGTKDSVLSNLGFKLWHTEELWELIEWVKNFNNGKSATDKIIFLGNDLQNMESTAKSILDFIAIYNPLKISEAEDILRPLLADSAYGGKFDPIVGREHEKRLIFTKEISLDLHQRVKKINDLINQISPPKNLGDSVDFTYRKRNAEILQQSLLLYSVFANFQKFSLARDSMMSENIKWIVENKSTSAPIFVWAHNEHIANLHTNMGGRLKNYYGNKYFILGIDFISGTVNATDFGKEESRTFTSCPMNYLKKKSLNNDVSIFNSKLIFLDLDSANNDALLTASKIFKKDVFIHSIGSEYYGPKHTYTIIAPKEYDALIFFSHSTPTEFIPKIGSVNN
jgi:erythromycin esterase